MLAMAEHDVTTFGVQALSETLRLLLAGLVE